MWFRYIYIVEHSFPNIHVTLRNINMPTPHDHFEKYIVLSKS